MSTANTLFAILADGLSTTLDPLQFAARLGFPKLDEWQKQLLLNRDDKRVILACGRQVGKTEIVSIMALFEAISRPDSIIIILAASLRQSGLLFSRVKKHYATLHNTLPNTISATQSTALTLSLQNGSRIVALPAREETIRGWANVSLLLIDEAAHVDTDLYRATRAFLAVSDGRLILLSTPHSKRGFFFEAWENHEEDWTRVKVTTEQCPRVSDNFLQQERRALGDVWYRQEYLASFEDSAYALIPYEVIQRAIDPSLKMLDIDLELDGDDDEFRLQYDAKQLDIDLED